MGFFRRSVHLSGLIALSLALSPAFSIAIAGCASANGNKASTGGGSSTSTSTGRGTGGAGTATGMGGGITIDAGSGDAGEGGCVGDPPPPLDASVAAPVFAPAFSPFYTVYDLGPVPGMPAGHLGGCVIQQGNPGTLLIAGNSEAAGGAIYSIQVQRNQCGHIVGWNGTATVVAQTPYIDANLIYGANGVLLYTQWDVDEISQLPAGASAPAVTTDMMALGVPVSVSGLAFVPPNLPAAGGLRTVTWSGGDWFHLGLSAMGQLYTLSAPVQTTTLPNGPGGLAYVPQGSPGFAKQSLIVAEWSANKVGVYEVDDQGDPVVTTRQDFFSSFPAPWGAYFEPETGDYLFLTWGPSPDRVYVVQGFALPPPPPPPPQ